MFDLVNSTSSIETKISYKYFKTRRW